MTRIIQDLEHGAVVLLHELGGQPTPGETVPEEALGAVKALAAKLGIVEDDIGPFSVGYLFDLLNSGIEAISTSSEGSGHAQAGAPTTDPAAAPETAVTAPETAVGAPETVMAAPAGGEVAVGGAEPTSPPVEQAAPGVPSAAADGPDVDSIIQKATAQWAGGNAPTA